jgi:molybdopterin molybdotransferase
MLSVEEALRAVLGRAEPLPRVRVRLGEASQSVLAEDVHADLDMPPFDKSLVDGYAVRSTDLREPGALAFRVVDEITAGKTSTRVLGPGECVAIMTGAPLPAGADAVVMHEKTERTPDGQVLIPGPVTAGLNRLERGREMRAGDVVLRAGEGLNAPRVGVLASVGRPEVDVVRRPDVRIIPTGDELVEVGQVPGPGRIRNSNAVVLAALVSQAAPGSAIVEPIAPDDAAALRTRFAAAVGDARSEGRAEADVLVISGGVSAGKLDLVPSCLEAVGVEPVFHKVSVRPGKPLWFGVGPEREGRPRALVFGLPGNPVSGVVNALLFVIPVLRALAGHPPAGPRLSRFSLASPYRHRGDRATYHPARLVGSQEAIRVDPLPWAGSPDLLTVAKADGFAAFPAGDRDYEAGDPIDFLPLDGAGAS